ncbi:MAG TPA: GAF domain-containing sensor histidine kinase [Candidatus Dormibacteraeota bacterium]|nr:GAF domain-containing sensor histidine kinase [Candidatus Dormibacteraeota bacterium]
MSANPEPPLSLIRRQLVGHLNKPAAEVIDRALACLIEALEARTAFLARVEDRSLEVVAVHRKGGPALEPGVRIPLDESFLAAEDDAENDVINVRDAAKRQPFKSLAMRQQLDIASYLGVAMRGPGGDISGTLAVIGEGPRVFSEADQDLLMVVAGFLGRSLEPLASPGNGQARTPVSALRLASEEVKEPLAILRGYADMLSNGEVPADQMPVVAERLASQSEMLMRIADQVLLLSRLPLELSFTVRVSLGAVARSAADRIRPRLVAAGMDLRLQLDANADVWGDSVLLEAALDEMLHNVFKHAKSATVVQLRLRQASADRFQLIVKDDGPGMSADRLAELFGPPADEQPERGQGLGLYLLRRVAEAHGGRTWANSLEGKGTTFYLELPAASPDGDSARVSAAAAPA